MIIGLFLTYSFIWGFLVDSTDLIMNTALIIYFFSSEFNSSQFHLIY